jgi:hypothetical protein
LSAVGLVVQPVNCQGFFYLDEMLPVSPLADECLVAKPSQAKVLTGGGDFRFAQVDVPLSVSHSCV